MYHVLVPVDSDEQRATAQLETLRSLPADPDDLSVTVLHVLEEIDTIADEGGTTFIDDVNESLSEIRDVPDTVPLIEERLADDGIDVERMEMVGDPADGIGQVAAEIDADAILLGVRKRSPVGKAIFGSVSQRVIIDADRPVIIAE
ncbi:universal stress protein [Natrinema thermotolerans]|uniref:Universal stress protein n=1 Tax=Natrinema thermotolerans TaxID=121872 RepID=A0AAF0SXU5_9EURY|nr:universal stress protein [Natrinema thermotolerans]QCC59493.1 universal stress protein [Natrinema thermotolerans]WMT06466.1 universal stress protein [Natrinema thermotolerans]